MNPGRRSPVRNRSGQSLPVTLPRHQGAPQRQANSWSNEKLKVP